MSQEQTQETSITTSAARAAVAHEVNRLRGGTDKLPGYLKYRGQCNPQPAHIEIDPEDEEVTCGCSGEIGDAVPSRVWHGRTVRISVSPFVSAATLADFLEEHAALIERAFAGYECEWDGSNHVGRWGDDGGEALEELRVLAEELPQSVVYESLSEVYGHRGEQFLSELKAAGSAEKLAEELKAEVEGVMAFDLEAAIEKWAAELAEKEEEA